MGKSTIDRKLTKREFALVQQAWAVKVPLFAQLLDAYNAAMRGLRKNRRVLLKHWVIPRGQRRRWTADELQRVTNMQKMSRRCLVPPLRKKNIPTGHTIMPPRTGVPESHT